MRRFEGDVYYQFVGPIGTKTKQTGASQEGGNFSPNSRARLKYTKSIS